MSLWVAENHTPFAVGRSFVRDREGREVWAVAIRATFQIEADGSLGLAAEQVPVSRAASYRGQPGNSSLLFDTDFAFTKLATDVVLQGHAWAPAQRAAPSVAVSLQLGAIRKQLCVHGARTWARQKESGGQTSVPSRAQPFLKWPIVYEHAWGGLDPEGAGGWELNPVGLGFAKQVATLEERPVPNVEDPREPLTVAGQAPSQPAGFGAIAPHWAQRTRYAGTYDARWQRERAPLWPEDFDTRFFQVAPPDQQIPGFLRGGEVCELRNLTPQGALRFTLPRLRITTTTHFKDSEVQRVADLHLVSVDTDALRVQLVWQMTLECHGREHLLRCTRIRWEGERICRSQSTPTV
ncbi:MAG: hypothetical protein RL701_92 [Pseudomonadota bacterium]|jgi:hypothetical protein